MAFHGVEWDCDTERPVIDGKTINPNTGEVQPRGKSVYRGPPSIQTIWHNLCPMAEGCFLGVTSQQPGTLNDLFLRIAKHVEAGLYKLVGVNATPYAFFIFCETDVTDREFRRVVFNHDDDPDQVSFVDGQGVMHKVYFPLEKEDEVLDLFRAKDWEGLKKFPSSRVDGEPGKEGTDYNEGK